MTQVHYFLFRTFAVAFGNRVARAERFALIKATDASAFPHHNFASCVGDPGKLEDAKRGNRLAQAILLTR